MCADKRMIATRRPERVIYCRNTLSDIATAVVGGIVLQTEICDTAPEFLRQRFIGTVHAAEIGVRPIDEDSACAIDAVQDRTAMTRMSGTSSLLRPSSLGPQQQTANALTIAQFSLSSLPLIQMIRARASVSSPW